MTSAFTIHMDDGSTRFEQYPGEFPTSHDPVRRFERMLWFFQAGDAKYDPIYGVYRRRHIVESHPLRPSERADWFLSAELALRGPILNSPSDSRTARATTRSESTGQRSGLASIRSGRSSCERARDASIASSTPLPFRPTSARQSCVAAGGPCGASG